MPSLIKSPRNLLQRGFASVVSVWYSLAGPLKSWQWPSMPRALPISAYLIRWNQGDIEIYDRNVQGDFLYSTAWHVDQCGGVGCAILSFVLGLCLLWLSPSFTGVLAMIVLGWAVQSGWKACFPPYSGRYFDMRLLAGMVALRVAYYASVYGLFALALIACLQSVLAPLALGPCNYLWVGVVVGFSRYVYHVGRLQFPIDFVGGYASQVCGVLMIGFVYSLGLIGVIPGLLMVKVRDYILGLYYQNKKLNKLNYCSANVYHAYGDCIKLFDTPFLDNQKHYEAKSAFKSKFNDWLLNLLTDAFMEKFKACVDGFPDFFRLDPYASQRFFIHAAKLYYLVRNKIEASPDCTDVDRYRRWIELCDAAKNQYHFVYDCFLSHDVFYADRLCEKVLHSPPKQQLHPRLKMLLDKQSDSACNSYANLTVREHRMFETWGVLNADADVSDADLTRLLSFWLSVLEVKFSNLQAWLGRYVFFSQGAALLRFQKLALRVLVDFFMRAHPRILQLPIKHFSDYDPRINGLQRVQLLLIYLRLDQSRRMSFSLLHDEILRFHKHIKTLSWRACRQDVSVLKCYVACLVVIAKRIEEAQDTNNAQMQRDCQRCYKAFYAYLLPASIDLIASAVAASGHDKAFAKVMCHVLNVVFVSGCTDLSRVFCDFMSVQEKHFKQLFCSQRLSQYDVDLLCAGLKTVQLRSSDEVLRTKVLSWLSSLKVGRLTVDDAVQAFNSYASLLNAVRAVGVSGSAQCKQSFPVQVGVGCTEQIKKAYRLMALFVHPDKNPALGKLFPVLNEVNKCLTCNGV